MRTVGYARFASAAALAFCLGAAAAEPASRPGTRLGAGLEVESGAEGKLGPKVRLGDKTFEVTVVNTPETRARGLSGSGPLAANEGMLFVFERDGAHAIWMKDMRFSIDIVWISRFGSVVHVERNVHPNTYPKSFASPKPARYVLEIPAGAGRAAAPGDPAYFDNVPLRPK